MKYTSTLRDALRSVRQLSAVDGNMAGTIQRALTAAGLQTTTGLMARVNDTMRRALAHAGLEAYDAETREPGGDAGHSASPSAGNSAIHATSPSASHSASPSASHPASQLESPRMGLSRLHSSVGLARGRPGQFLRRSYSNAAGTRDYKLYVPGCCTGTPMPLIVMLHGCTQDPDDFAAGTHMNELADEKGCLVAYPAQAANANGAKCWNWFNPTHQVADRGEPSLIAGITREVASLYPVDRERIFVAGLSAGAAMAVVLGATYAELFAAVGAHSGLPYGAAYDVPSAFAAMRGGVDPRSRGGESHRSSKPQTAGMRGTPTIVFHGDQDTTVNAMNGSAIVSQAVALAECSVTLTRTVQARKSVNGRECTATIYRDSTRRTHVEEWILHGAGHAWSGGSSDGSYTDVIGPDASAEMHRFFLAQSPPGDSALKDKG